MLSSGSRERNVGDTRSYSYLDHTVSSAAYHLSRIFGVRQITRPFWVRWRTSVIGEPMLSNFLNAIRDLDAWPAEALKIADGEREAFDRSRESMPAEQQVEQLRRLSYLYHLAHWSCLRVCDEKIHAYRLSREYYIEAETLACGADYQRVEVGWKGRSIKCNLHFPAGSKGPRPILFIVHGMDDTKEEHLSTELQLRDRGYAVVGFDGPGQGEALWIDNLYWGHDFDAAMSALVDEICLHERIDAAKVGLVGISWGGYWALRAAALNPRVDAVFDLGGPVNAEGFKKLPFFLKTKMVQCHGSPEGVQPQDLIASYSLEEGEVLASLAAHVCIVHGGRDPLVPLEHKQWLHRRLREMHPARSIDLITYADGDHCCTNHTQEVLRDAVRFFDRTLS